jgi:hypothetical protein
MEKRLKVRLNGWLFEEEPPAKDMHEVMNRAEKKVEKGLGKAE